MKGEASPGGLPCLPPPARPPESIPLPTPLNFERPFSCDKLLHHHAQTSRPSAQPRTGPRPRPTPSPRGRRTPGGAPRRPRGRGRGEDGEPGAPSSTCRGQRVAAAARKGQRLFRRGPQRASLTAPAAPVAPRRGLPCVCPAAGAAQSGRLPGGGNLRRSPQARPPPATSGPQPLSLRLPAAEVASSPETRLDCAGSKTRVLVSPLVRTPSCLQRRPQTEPARRSPEPSGRRGAGGGRPRKPLPGLAQGSGASLDGGWSLQTRTVGAEDA